MLMFSLFLMFRVKDRVSGALGYIAGSKSSAALADEQQATQNKIIHYLTLID